MNNDTATIRLLLVSYLPPLVVLALAWLLADMLGVPFSTLTRDTAAVAKLPFVTGWINYLGAVLMAAAASIALFTAVHVRAAHVRAWRYLAGMGLLSLALLGDDLFMLHDGLLAFMGVDEKLVIGTYALILLFILGSNLDYVRQTGLPLAIALLFFGLSSAVDLSPDRLFANHRHLLEDGAKLLGIAGWLGYIVQVCHVEISRGRASAIGSS
jgi:hypothetical protein